MTIPSFGPDTLEINPESVRVVEYTTSEVLRQLQDQMGVLSHNIEQLILVTSAEHSRIRDTVEKKLSTKNKRKKKGGKKK